jgi:hypothetical protein
MGLKFRPVKTYSASDMDAVVKMANSLPNLEEGCIDSKNELEQIKKVDEAEEELKSTLDKIKQIQVDISNKATKKGTILIIKDYFENKKRHDKEHSSFEKELKDKLKKAYKN